MYLIVHKTYKTFYEAVYQYSPFVLKTMLHFLIFKYSFQCNLETSLLQSVPDIIKLCIKQINTLYEEL